jgi:hypothetical protein
MSMFANAKDRMMEQGALAYINGQLLAPYGQATKLRLNSQEKTMAVELVLKGESSPLTLEIAGFDFSEEAGKYYIFVRDARTSREWLTALAATHFCGRKIEIPESAGRWLARMF